MSFVAALDASDARLGGKARSLARLAAAGLSTPAGFVVTDAVFRAVCPTSPALREFDEAAWAAVDELRCAVERTPWPQGLRDELVSHLREVGGERFSVRSSFACEDIAGALAAGVYESCVDVPFAEVEDAIRRVLASAVSPGAAAYALAHGRSPGDPPVAVLVHGYVEGEAEGAAAFAPGVAAEAELMLRRGSLPAQAQAELRGALHRLAREMGPVEVEWVLRRGGLVYLQVRPFQPKAAPSEWQGWKGLAASDAPRTAWRWDAAHNPLPLSPAQAGLVELVDQHCRIGIRQRVLGGYLFYATDSRALPAAIEPAIAADYFASLRSDFDASAAALGSEPSVEAALALFASVYERIFGVLQPALKRRRQKLEGFLRAHAPAELGLLPALGTDVPSMAEERRRRAAAIRQGKTDEEISRARADYLVLFGDESPIWDVSAPTYAEDPSPLLLAGSASSHATATVSWQSADRQVMERLREPERAVWQRLLPEAREAISLSEADDWLYARAQAILRRALLAQGRELVRMSRLADAADIFFLPLQMVLEFGLRQPSVDLSATVRTGRSAWRDAHNNPPPVAFSGDDKAVRGHGTGGHAIGRIALHRSGAVPSLAPDAILLAQTLLPTELPLITAAAIITETGGPLDHVAAQARERGIPAVIGAAGATRVLNHGDLALVDGDRGFVIKLAGA